MSAPQISASGIGLWSAAPFCSGDVIAEVSGVLHSIAGCNYINIKQVCMAEPLADTEGDHCKFLERALV
jgi:hypothetical protein